MGKSWRERLDLAEEALPGETVTEILKDRVLIEHHEGIVEYADTCVAVRVRFGVIRINGQALSLLRMKDNQVIIKGSIESVVLERKDENAGA